MQEIAARYGVLLKDKGVALRGLFVINPEGILEQATINNLPIGRSVDEALRLLQAIQFTAEHGEVSVTSSRTCCLCCLLKQQLRHCFVNAIRFLLCL